MFERKSKSESAEAPAPPRPAESSAATTPTPPPVTKRGATAMIGSKVKIDGDIHSSEDLLIEGEVSGTVSLPENELVIGNSGRVMADLNAKTIRIEGHVEGDIKAHERVVITASGNVQGNLSSPRVMLEDGSRFKGSIDMGSQGAAAAKPTLAAAPKAAAPASEKRDAESTG